MKVSSRQINLLCILVVLFVLIIVIRDLIPCNLFRMSGFDSMISSVFFLLVPAAILLIIPLAGVALVIVVAAIYGISRFIRSLNWNNRVDAITDLVLFFVIIALIFGGVFIPRSLCKIQPATAQLSNESIASSEQGWNIYTGLRFSIQYPDDAKPSSELNAVSSRFTRFGALSAKYFEVRLQNDDIPEMGVNFGYLDTEITSKDVIVGGARGYMAVSVAGYGDAGHQGPPFVEFGVRYGGYMYHVIFYGDAELSKEERKILESFTFLK